MRHGGRHVAKVVAQLPASIKTHVAHPHRVPGTVRIGQHENTCEHHYVDTSTRELKGAQRTEFVTRMIIMAILANKKKKKKKSMSRGSVVQCSQTDKTVDRRGRGHVHKAESPRDDSGEALDDKVVQDFVLPARARDCSVVL